MIEHVTWKRCAAAVGATVLLGLSACSGSDDSSDAGADTSSSATATIERPTGRSSDSSAPLSTTTDPSENGGWKALPDCSEFARSIVEDQDVAEGEQVEGTVCRYDIGSDRVIGRQVVWITRHGGDWPTTFKKTKLNDKLAEAADPGDGDFSSSVNEIDAPGWTYGIQFTEQIGKNEWTAYRLFAFSDNGDLLSCNTGISDIDLDAFLGWCDEVKAAVTP